MADRPEYARREALPLPDKPPYTAHLGNLAFDVMQPDVEKFLEGCQVTSVRIVEDKMDHKPKGFGYVEFATVDGLKKALTLSESSFMGRNIRISVAEPCEYLESDMCHSSLTQRQPRSARNLTATSRTGLARDLSPTFLLKVASHQEASAVVTSTTHQMPAASVVAAGGLDTSRMMARSATSATGSARVLFRLPPAARLLARVVA